MAETTFPIESLDKLFAAAAERGVGRDELLAAAGLDLDSGQWGVTFEQLAAAYEVAARLAGDDQFGLHVGERTAPSMYGLTGYLFAHATTLQDALESLAKFQQLWSNAAGFHFAVGKRGAHLRYWHASLIPAIKRRQESEQMMAAVLSIIRGLLEERVEPIEVAFEHPRPSSDQEHQRVFGPRVRFGAAATEIILPKPLLDRRLPGADRQLAKLIKRQAERELIAVTETGDALERLRRFIRAQIERSGDLSLETAAASQNVGPRTLQRRLHEAGVTLTALVEQERIDIAKKLLDDPGRSIGGIAHLLGYSQPSAFHRAFQRASGQTPTQYRTR